LTRVFMQNTSGDSVRIVERKSGDVLMTIIRRDGVKRDWVTQDTKQLIVSMERVGFRIVEREEVP